MKGGEDSMKFKEAMMRGLAMQGIDAMSKVNPKATLEIMHSIMDDETIR